TLARMRLHAARDERLDAVRRGEALLAVHENSLYAPQILFELAVLHRRLRNNTKAAASLRALLDRHPESPLVDQARDLLEMLDP
ncbi:MAG: hypothetical protein IID33_11885, partial [Planctomycetes bacterium]|nr:hypothetical protein [Planctomycetota bacterium]